MKDACVPRIALSSVTKRFGGTYALNNVSLTVEPGEVHGLVGENGSGKSTLIKVLAGFHAPDSGDLFVDGAQVKLPLRVGQFRELGIDFVHQDLGLVEALTASENLYLGRIAAPKRRWHISWRQHQKTASQVFERYGVTIPATAKISSLTPLQRAQLAIVRAVESMNGNSDESTRGAVGGLLVLDEATVFLSRAERDDLFALLRALSERRVSVIIVSHDLDQIFDVTTRITVLRDGRVAGVVATAETSREAIVSLMIGHSLMEAQKEPANAEKHETLTLEATGITGLRVNGVDFTARAGEIVGVTGIMGSGWEELPYLLYGVAQARSGEITVRGERLELRQLNPVRAMKAGIALVPADRRRSGIAGELSVTDNLTIPTLQSYYRFVLRKRKMRRDVSALMEAFDMRPRDPQLAYAKFSGGNQQKGLLAKWLQLRPKLFLLDEPTQGVDVGAREQIFALMRSAAADGTGILCASCDYEQLAAICDRVLIFSNGVVTAELVGEEISKRSIATRAHSAQPSTSSRRATT